MSIDNRDILLGMMFLCFWKISQALILMHLDTETSSLLFLGYSNV